MTEYISEIVIVKEYLNNWFTPKELAEYLCISVEEVKKALNSVLDEDVCNKITRHEYLIDKYNKNIDDEEVLVIEPEYREDIDMGFYLLNNHCSIKECADHFGKGKSTVHEHIHKVLPEVDIILYKNVFDVLMEHKSFDTNNKKVIEQVLTSYELLKEGHSINEISEIQGIGWNVVERNLTRRLKKIDKEKYEVAKKILEKNQKDVIKEHEFKKKS